MSPASRPRAQRVLHQAVPIKGRLRPDDLARQPLESCPGASRHGLAGKTQSAAQVIRRACPIACEPLSRTRTVRRHRRRCRQARGRGCTGCGPGLRRLAASAPRRARRPARARRGTGRAVSTRNGHPTGRKSPRDARPRGPQVASLSRMPMRRGISTLARSRSSECAGSRGTRKRSASGKVAMPVLNVNACAYPASLASATLWLVDVFRPTHGVRQGAHVASDCALPARAANP